MAEEYAAWLAGAGLERGLLGPREVPRLWDRHLLNCAVLTDLVPQRATVADVGSGAGLPGLVMAIRRPDLRVCLVEPLLRRTVFLVEVVGALRLDNVEVVRSRAEALHGARSFDVVTARAVAPLDRLAASCLPLVAPGGELVAMKGSSAGEELEASRAVLARLGALSAEVVTVPIGDDFVPTTAVRVRVGASQALGSDPDAPTRPRGGPTGRRRKRR